MEKNKYLSQYLRFLVIFIFLNVFLVNQQMLAQGNITISPSRLVFEGQKKIMELNITNLDSQDSAKYVLSFVQVRMTEDGKFQWITAPDPGQKFADKFIRVFPRIIRLGPNDTQVVRLQLTRSEQLEPGEYRSHLYFKSLIPQKAMEGDDIKKNSDLSLNIEMTFGITAPIIIRVGESTTMLNLNNLKLITTTEGTKKISLNINRTGNMSVFGEVSVLYVAPNGKETLIGLNKGVAVYTPNVLLKLEVNLDKPNVDLSKGKIRVTYSNKNGTRTEKYAEAELIL